MMMEFMKMCTDTASIIIASLYLSFNFSSGFSDGVSARGPFRETTQESEDICVALCLSRNCGFSWKPSTVPSAVKNDGHDLVLRQEVSDWFELRRRNIDGGRNMSLPVFFFSPCIHNQHLSRLIDPFFHLFSRQVGKVGTLSAGSDWCQQQGNYKKNFDAHWSVLLSW